jgi:tungstate transport system substrate-binding protein
MSDPDDGERDEGRRAFLRLAGALGGGAMLGVAGCAREPQKADPVPSPSVVTPNPTNANVVRVVSVPTAVEGDVLPTLITEFHKHSALRVQLVTSNDLYDVARRGEADLAISHYGHKHAEEFVMDGFGEWPRTLFSNQMALLGPASDPARIRGLDDAGEAFRRIALAKAPFVLNDIDGVRYLTEILWNVAGRPDRAGWLLDDRKFRKEDAIHQASKLGAYTFWGLTPFLRLRNDKSVELEPLVLGDPLLQRMLVSIIVKPSKIAGVNAEGAHAFEKFLLEPATQSLVRQTRYPGVTQCLWTPGGRHNRTGILPKA